MFLDGSRVDPGRCSGPNDPGALQHCNVKQRTSVVACRLSDVLFSLIYLPVPALTKVNSLEDEGIVLKVEESEEQKKEIKKEGGVEHQEMKEEKQTEQFNEPSTSSGSACPEVRQTFFLVLYVFVLMVGEAKPTSS